MRHEVKQESARVVSNNNHKKKSYGAVADGAVDIVGPDEIDWYGRPREIEGQSGPRSARCAS